MVCLLLSSMLDLQQKRKLGLHSVQPLECTKGDIISSGRLWWHITTAWFACCCLNSNDEILGLASTIIVTVYMQYFLHENHQVYGAFTRIIRAYTCTYTYNMVRYIHVFYVTYIYGSGQP
jgi:hypothetical protein